MSGENSSFRLRVIIAFAVVYVVWGSTNLAIGIAVKYLPPAVMGAARFSTAGAAMLVWCALRGKRVRLRRHELLRLGMIGVLLLCTGNVMLGWAETYIPTGLAALLGAVSPLCFVVLERLSQRGERIEGRALAGILFGLLGFAVLLWPSLRAGLHVGHRELIGAALVLCCSISWASGSILSKRSALELDTYAASAWEMLLGGLVNLAVSLATGGLGAAVWTREALWALAYLIVAGSWIGFTAYVWLLHHAPISKVATHAYVNPIVAVVLGWLVLHERITGYIMAGSAIVVVSVILVTGAKRRLPSAADVGTPANAVVPPQPVEKRHSLGSQIGVAGAVQAGAGELAEETAEQALATKANIRNKAFLGEQA